MLKCLAGQISWNRSVARIVAGGCKAKVAYTYAELQIILESSCCGAAFYMPSKNKSV